MTSRRSVLGWLGFGGLSLFVGRAAAQTSLNDLAKDVAPLVTLAKQEHVRAAKRLVKVEFQNADFKAKAKAKQEHIEEEDELIATEREAAAIQMAASGAASAVSGIGAATNGSAMEIKGAIAKAEQATHAFKKKLVEARDHVKKRHEKELKAERKAQLKELLDDIEISLSNAGALRAGLLALSKKVAKPKKSS